jgi:predicted helicase
MLRDWSRANDLFLIEEQEFPTKLKTKVYPDGTIVHNLRVPLGYWEAKDTQDDLDAEIEKKTSKGYPTTNIIYENSETAVLLQNGHEVLRCAMTDVDDLSKLLSLFFAYERPEIADFRRAVEQFKTDLPAVLEALREQIDAAYTENDDFSTDAERFLAHAKDTINPTIGDADIREMLIQHILTEEIFNHVFNEGDFHRENNVAQQLYELERKFFRGAIKRDTLKSLEPYYAAIRAAAASITAHLEKQKFLKVIYENFYKVYNPKAADRLGVVYTPNEIVRFMIDGADWLCRTHFDRGLIDPKVDILDPCTGTGTYICELLETFRGDRKKLAHKYKNELHANELAILPYYVANLNIEATYAAITGQYAEYPNLCFVDTLDNVAALGIRSGHQHDMFGAVSDENIERVKRQNQKTISVVIGNPPYNANQQNENDNNKNRTYKRIDESIKTTYVAKSTAQKTKVYDMYSRFFRWATDRLGDDGIIAYITNRSFIDSRTFDGFRSEVFRVFDEIYVVDLGGDVRANPKLSGTKHNVFGIQTGVAICFMVKKKHGKKDKQPAKIKYIRRPEMEVADDKLAFLAASSLETLELESITPSKRGNWINQVENVWDDLLPIATKSEKAGQKGANDRAIFRIFSLGVSTNRDEWLYDFSNSVLGRKSAYLVDKYDEGLRNGGVLSTQIKTSRNLKRRLEAGRFEKYNISNISISNYRPFAKKFLYRSELFIDESGSVTEIAPFENSLTETNASLMVCGHAQIPFTVHSAIGVSDAGYASRATKMLPRHRYTKSCEKIDNITDWALNKFRKHYGKISSSSFRGGGAEPETQSGEVSVLDSGSAFHASRNDEGEDEANTKTTKRAITKDDIFHYCYAVLHDPIYRETYAINLKREFPRIPYYPNFAKWVAWGEALMNLHINYEEVEPFPLERLDEENKRAEGSVPKAMLKSDHENGTIRLDADTQLTGVPEAAWRYKLGNRTAIDWVLDQHKEKKPRDPTIREKFNTYRFADYKEKVIDLLGRVTQVSVETVSITEAMSSLDRSGWK